MASKYSTVQTNDEVGHRWPWLQYVHENGRSIFVAPSGLLYVDWLDQTLTCCFRLWFFEDDNSYGDHGVDHSAVYNAFILPNVASVVCHLQSENERSNCVAPLGLQYVNRLD